LLDRGMLAGSTDQARRVFERILNGKRSPDQ
jgi:hypothetical protein